MRHPSVGDRARPKRLLPWLASAMLLLVWCEASAQVAGDPTPSSVDRDTARLLDEIRQVEHDRRERLASDLEQRQRDDRRVEDLEVERKTLERAVAGLEREIAREREAFTARSRTKAKLVAEQEALAKEAQGLRTRLREYVTKVRDRVTTGIPWHKAERLELVQSVMARLSSQDTRETTATPAQDLEAVASLQTSEESLARLVEASSLTLDAGSVQTSVRAFRWGLLAVLFANEGGTTAGYCRPGEELSDGVRNLSAHPDSASGYERALDILSRRRTPAIVDLRIPSLPVRKEGSR